MTPKSQKDCKSKSKTHVQDSIPSFIRKTYDILEERKFPDVIDWNPEGTALVIKKPSEFCQKVLPAYFKHNNLTSFVRQLNMYNFHKRRTQNIDHVYYHELFQKGKKHLLKEIKRKNHDQGSDKTKKIAEVLEPSQNGKDFSSLAYENQLLKRLYNDAMNKIAMLEGQAKDLQIQNQSLWSQVCQKNEQDGIFKPSFARFDSKTELTLDQLPMTFSEVVIPPLKIVAERQANNTPYTKAPSTINNVNCYLNFTNEEPGDPTEASYTSPSLQPSMETDKCFDMPDATPLYKDANTQVMQLPHITLTPQVSIFQGYKPNELAISKQEVSLGQIFDSWGNEQPNMEMFSFLDQRLDKPVQEAQQPTSVLGKRQLEVSEDKSFHVPEPLLKRHELSIYSRKAMISNGEPIFKRDSSVNFDYDANVDLMDFNQPFLEWAKAS